MKKKDNAITFSWASLTCLGTVECVWGKAALCISMELAMVFHQGAVDLQERGSFFGISLPAAEHEAVH